MEKKQQKQEHFRKVVKLYCLAVDAKEIAKKIESMTEFGSKTYNREKINELNGKLYDLACDIQYFNNIEQ